MTIPGFKRLSVVIQKLRSAAGLPVGHIALTVLVWILLWPARLAVLTIPLRHLSRAFGEDRGAGIEPLSASDKAIAIARPLSKAITLAARNSPASLNCYPQALVARMLLSLARIEHGLYFGVRKGAANDALEAHAWVMVGDLSVSGGHSFDRYTVVRSFNGGTRKSK